MDLRRSPATSLHWTDRNALAAAVDGPGLERLLTWIKAGSPRAADSPAMHPDLLARYEQRVPRYTSYPTSPHFGPDIGADAYAAWLGQIPAEVGASRHGRDAAAFLPEIQAVDRLAADGLAARRGHRVMVPDEARPFLRTVCAVFDAHLNTGAARHSRAV